MPLQTSGAISLLDIQNEFGGANPISINEYYGAGGAPASGTISLADFYGRSSEFSWILTIGSTGFDYLKGSAANGSAAWASGLCQGDRILLIKMNLDGSLAWQRSLNSNFQEDSEYVAVDSSGNSYLVGYTYPTSTNQDVYLAKYDTNGTVQWQRSISGTSGTTESGYAIAVAPNDANEIYLVGRISPGTGGAGFYIAKYNSSGTRQWQKIISLSGASWGAGVSVDGSGNVYVSGYQSDDGDYYIVVAKYNSSGTRQWLRTSFSINPDFWTRIKVSSSGNIYMASTINFGSTYSYENILTKFDTNGNVVWQRGLGSSSSFPIRSYDIALDSSENVYVAGGEVTSGGIYRAHIVKYNSSGTLQFQRNLGGANNTYTLGYGISVATNHFYLAGVTTVRGAGNQDGLFVKFKTDGSQTGSYGVPNITYTSSSLVAFTPNYSFSASSPSEVTPTFTSSSRSLTSASAGLSTIINQI